MYACPLLRHAPTGCLGDRPGEPTGRVRTVLGVNAVLVSPCPATQLGGHRAGGSEIVERTAVARHLGAAVSSHAAGASRVDRSGR